MITKKIVIPKFTENEKVIEFDEEGHNTLFGEKGRHGHLKVRVKVEHD